MAGWTEMEPEEDVTVAEGPCPMLPRARSGDVDVSDEENVSKRPPTDLAKQDGGRSPSGGCASIDYQMMSNERQESTAVDGEPDFKPSNASHPVTDANPRTSSSDTVDDIGLFTQCGSKLPLSPGRAQSVSSESQNYGDTAPGEDATRATGAAGILTMVRMNRCVASAGGSAAPKAVVSKDQVAGKGGTGQQGQNVPELSQTAAKQGEPALKEWPASLCQATKLVAPPKPEFLENGEPKSNQHMTESTGGALSERERRKRLHERHREGSPKAKEAALDNQESAVLDGCASGLDRPKATTIERSENLPTGTEKSVPAAPVKVARMGLVLPGAVSSDSEDEDEPVSPHSPRVVRATALSQRSRDLETPRSAMPRSARANSHHGSTWTISTPIQDRNIQTYTRRRRGVTLTSMEQEVAGAPQARPFSPTHTVSDAFNMHFDSREDQSWQVDDGRPHLASDSPFGRPRRSSNPTSEVSGVSDCSGYYFRESVSDASSRPGSLGLGRFGGHAVPRSTTDAWTTCCYTSNSMAPDTNQGDPKLRQRVSTVSSSWTNCNSDGSIDMGNGRLKRAGRSNHGSGASVLSYQQLQVHQGILPAPKGRSLSGSRGNGDGQTGSDVSCSWGNDCGMEGGRPAAFRQRALERMADQAPRGSRSTYEPRNCSVRDDDSDYCASLSNSACGSGRRRSIGGKILQVAVFGVAGVAALVFGGELIKATPIEEDDDRD